MSVDRLTSASELDAFPVRGSCPVVLTEPVVVVVVVAVVVGCVTQVATAIEGEMLVLAGVPSVYVALGDSAK